MANNAKLSRSRVVPNLIALGFSLPSRELIRRYSSAFAIMPIRYLRDSICLAVTRIVLSPSIAAITSEIGFGCVCNSVTSAAIAAAKYTKIMYSV